MEQQQLTRRQLYDLVWSTPMIKLAPRFGMSDVALRKRCHNHEIPTPGAGYWAQVAAGYAPEKVALPPADIRLEHIVFENRAAATDGPGVVPPIVVVPDKFLDPHPVAIWLDSELRSAKADRNGRLLIGFQEFPEAVLTAKCGPRALRIVDAFCKALEARGHQVQAGTRGTGSSRKEMLVVAFDETLAISIEEKLAREPHVLTTDERREKERWEKQGWGTWDRAPKYDYAPSGELKLCLKLSHYKYVGRKSWSDTKFQRLDDLLGQALLAFEAAAQLSRQEHLDQERIQRAHRDAERKRLRGERLEWYRAELAEELEEMSAAWAKAAELQQFLAAYDRALPAERRTALDNKWFEAVKSYATRLDPLSYAATLAKELEPSDEELEKLIEAKNNEEEGDNA
jgi:hypothetical protein